MKTILLHIHDDAEQENRLQVALYLARLSGGHIACVQVAPVELFNIDPYGGLFGLAAIIETIRDQDRMTRQSIEARLLREGVSWNWKYYDGGVLTSLMAEARLADVIVLSQPSQGRHSAAKPLPIVGDIAVHARAPVLMVPSSTHTDGPSKWTFDISGNALVAWNGSAEAANAFRLTLPLLLHAAFVHIIEVNGDAATLPSTEAATYLSRHGIKAELHEWPAKGRSVSDALLNAMSELDGCYLAMGAYGHSRLREFTLGGVTRELISSSSAPLLLAH